MSAPDPPSSSDRPGGGEVAENGFNPFRLLDVESLEGPTLDRYAVYLVGLRRTLRDGLKRAGPQEALLLEFLEEVDDALFDALAARRARRQ